MPSKIWHEEKDYPTRYRELVKAARAGLPDFNPTLKDLKDVILRLALEQPEIVGRTFAEDVIPALVKKALENELREIERERSDLEKRRSAVSAREINADALETRLKGRENAVVFREKQLNEAAGTFGKLLEGCETPEMKDRIRAYVLFKAETEKHVTTTANATAYIAGCASILAGAEMKIVSDMKNCSPPTAKAEYKVKRY